MPKVHFHCIFLCVHRNDGTMACVRLGRQLFFRPLWVYVPSIAPSHLVVYRSNAFPEWQGSLLIGSLAFTHLNRLVVEEGAVVLEERLARNDLGRIRSIAVDDEGLVYLGSDLSQVWRLRPE